MPSTGPGEFFSKTAELQLFDYLLKREDKAVLVCDRPVFNYITRRLVVEKKTLKAGLVCWADIKQSPEAPLRGYKNYFVCSLRWEAAILRHLRTLFPDEEVLGLVSDVACCLAANSNPWADGNSTACLDREIHDLDRLVLIFSTARSGSTYLCDLMCSSGLCGPTREDLRPHIVYLARHGKAINFDLQKWLAVLIHANKRDGIFASKIIAHFLFELLEHLDPELKKELSKKFEHTEVSVIYLYRSDKIKQAVSSYFANQVKVWHVESSLAKLEQKKRAGSVDYNFGKLKDALRFIRQNEEKLAKLLDCAEKKYTRVVYEDLTDAPKVQLLRIATALARLDAFDEDQASSKLQRTSNKKTAHMEEQFRVDLAQAQTDDLIEAQQ